MNKLQLLSYQSQALRLVPHSMYTRPQFQALTPKWKQWQWTKGGGGGGDGGCHLKVKSLVKMPIEGEKLKC